LTPAGFPAITARAEAAYWRRAVAVSAAAKAEKSQERFENALRDLFVGAPVEGQSLQYAAYSMQYTGNEENGREDSAV